MRAALHATITLGMVALQVAGAASAALVPGRTIRASTAEDGAQLAAGSFRPSVSADGRFVLFESAAPVVQEDTNGFSDIFLRDLETGVIERVSVSAGGVQGNDDSYAGFMTPDARFVGFVSRASNLIPGDTNKCLEEVSGVILSCPDVFLLDRSTGMLERASISGDELQANEESHNGVAISPDGRFLAFWSDASNLAPGDTNNRGDIYVRDRVAGTTERVSVGSGGVQGNGNSSEPAISADGRFVAFRSYASNLAGVDPSGNQFADIYVHDRLTGQTERVSVSSDGDDGIVNAYRPAISADGRFVAFDGEGTNLVPSDTNGFGYDVFVHDRLTGRTDQVSVNSAGIQANDNSYNPSITPDGRYVSFVSESTNLAPDDGGICLISEVEGNGSCRDVFVHDRQTGQTDQVAVATVGKQMDGHVWENTITPDGRYVAFEAASSALVPGDTNGAADAFLTDLGPATGVGELAVAADGDRIDVSGWSRFAGRSVQDSDSPTDAGPGARQLGTELIGARLSYRPEEADLLARLELDRLPPTPRAPATQVRAASLPGIVYGLELVIGGTRYELRATRGTGGRVGTTWVSASSFTLLRCAASCTEVATLEGSIGATGEHVNIRVPLSALGPPTPDTALTGVRGFVGPGEAATGAVTTIDEVRLPSLPLPAAGVRLGIAPAGTMEENVAFTSTATLSAGRFSGVVDASTLSPGAYDVWAIACLGDRCGSARARVQVT